MWGCGVGWGWYTPQTYVSVGLKMKVERQNIFDLTARDNFPTNFGCINVRRESVYWSMSRSTVILKLHPPPPAKTDTYAPDKECIFILLEYFRYFRFT